MFPSTIGALRLLKRRRLYSTVGQDTNPKSRHAQVYTNIIPAMIPVFLLGSAVYLGLQLTQLKLSQEKYMDDVTKRIEELEAEINTLQEKRSKQQQSSDDKLIVPGSSTFWWWWKY